MMLLFSRVALGDVGNCSNWPAFADPWLAVRALNLPIIQARLRPHADVREGMKKSEDVQKPQDHGNNHDRIQDGLDRSLHRYQVDKPKQNADYDQSAE
jgi:hypothetical protein